MRSNKTNELQIVRTICNSHCGGHCIIKVHVKDDKIVRIECDDADDSQYRACARGRAYRQRVYAPDRLLYPLKRTGERGAGEFTRVSWDEALETIAHEMKRVRDTYGPASILFFCSMTDSNSVHHERAINRLLCQFGGYTAPWGTISNEAQNFSSAMTYGVTYNVGHTPEDYVNSRLIIMWGWNPATTMQGTPNSWYLARAKEGGTKIICVDPKYTDSAATFADQWIPIRPGTDAAVFIAMAYVMISENLHDQRFLDTYTVGFDRFRDYVLGLEDGVEKTPEWAEAISGILAATIANLAREYAGTKPAALMPSLGPGRTAFGEQYHRAACTLAAMTGNIGIRGGNPGATLELTLGRSESVIKAIRAAVRIDSPPNQVEVGPPPRWNALPCRGKSVNSSARVNVNSFADAILKGKAGGYPADCKFLWISNCNYLNQIGDVNKMVKALRKLEFFLVTEQFMTATAKFADILLPVNTFMERDDFSSYGVDFYGLQSKMIEPLGESRAQLQICEGLASKLGISDYNDKSDKERVKSIVTKLSEEAGCLDYDTLRKYGVYKRRDSTFEESYVSFQKEIEDPEHNPFRTPSGKIEIYSQLIADMNHPQLPPIPKYIETWESLNDPLAKKYPLQLITTHFKWRAHSQFHNLPWLRDLQSQAVTMNTLDAESRGIRQGDMVKIFNDRGEVIIPARVTERIMPGVADIPEGAWYDPDANKTDRGGCSNTLTKNVTSPAGAFASHTALVQITKVGK